MINVTDSAQLLETMIKRRTYRSFDSEIPDEKMILDCIEIASKAPSGANMQPWTFVLIKDRNLRISIREKCEEIEKEFYEHRIPEEWKNRLEPLRTNFSKPFLTDAPYLIAVFAQSYGLDSAGNQIKHYFVNESVNLSIGFLIYSLHLCGLASLTYTPSPNGFLVKMLNRKENEKPVFLIPCGFPDSNYKLPEISKKEISEYLVIL